MLAMSLLRALPRDDLDLLIVGAGGGMEVETFAPAWQHDGEAMGMPPDQMAAIIHRSSC